MLARSSVLPAVEVPSGSTPIRTCVGCRQRHPSRDLLRVVAVAGALVPDVRLRNPGRGAWLHPTSDCLRLAQRRRAFPRALRVNGELDESALIGFIESLDAPVGEDGQQPGLRK
ncbi:YlxR family protein [Nakamurella silvestris]|nr:YlxR family protein [Nakamurella silvestris]